MVDASIDIIGAKTNNLKNVNATIPRNKLVVVTGVSGSGKSSLAFDTLYAEGQRRYVESLSAYARQFLGRMQKPDVEKITGIPPAIAIEQKVAMRSARSTVGTSTEIFFYLKLLFARVGKTFSPKSGIEVRKHTIKDVLDAISQQPLGTKIMLLAPIVLNGRTLDEQLHVWIAEGFSRLVRVNDLQKKDCEVVDISLVHSQQNTDKDSLFLLVDRVVANGEQSTLNRCMDSVQTAFYEGSGKCFLLLNNEQIVPFSTDFEADGITFIEPTEHLFDFNNPLGACHTCKGIGTIEGIDEDLVIPDKSLSVFEDAIACWRGEATKQWKEELIKNASKFKFPIHTPFYKLSDEQKQLLWKGNEYFQGLNDFFKVLQEQRTQKIQYLFLLSRFQGKSVCPDCGGGRLRKEATYVLVNGTNIVQLSQMSIDDLASWLENLHLKGNDGQIARPLIKEILSRVHFMQHVGLGYLSLSRLTSSLSGGEAQRINIAKSLGNNLVGSLYVLDEPSIGLHPIDTQHLIEVLQQLRDLGNTIVVVEHDEEIIQAADYILEIGPKAGTHGGEIVYQGKPKKDKFSYHFATKKRPLNNYITLSGACENNLKNLTVHIPLNAMTVVTGVSGSGKSTLIGEVFYPAMRRYFDSDTNSSFSNLSGSLHLVNGVEYVTQKPLSKSSRSNPVTYLKAFDDIRALFALQPLALQMGFTPAHFSFNAPGGRCEECQGAGTITIEMQFMADLVLECEHCHGKRFKKDVLEVLYKEKSIYDILEMTVDEAIAFFTQNSHLDSTQTAEMAKLCGRIAKRLQPLQDVGIGYVKLGQSSSTLSGGEAQRVKLASFLAEENTKPTIFIFDEPTIGLHSSDVQVLMKTFDNLISRGHTLIIIEHNPIVILQADYVIDLGLGGGKNGGEVVFAGTVADLLKDKKSITGQCLKKIAK